MLFMRELLPNKKVQSPLLGHSCPLCFAVHTPSQLPKSNSTHVYLRQTSLSSEGTYKCEVSADSPSFATVSIERQMKVYVLPKQKLSIVDNSVSAAGGQLMNHQQQLAASSSMLDQQQQQQQAIHTSTTRPSTLTYNMNDLVNLTCISGPSRPAAKLSWLLNEVPVSSSSKWLMAQQQQQITITPSKSSPQQQQQLTESRLTITFRLQSNHLLRNQSEPSHHYQSSRSQQQHVFQVIKLRCVAKLSIEFSSETSILVSGGKTTVKRRQQQQQQQFMAPLPEPSSLERQTSSIINRNNNNNNQNAPRENSRGRGQLSMAGVGVGATTTEFPMYRWPRPLVGGQVGPVQNTGGGHRTRSSSSSSSSALESFVDAWVTSPVSGFGGDLNSGDLIDGTNSSGSLSSGSGRATRPSSILRSSSGQHIVWTNRQLRDQAEHIDQMLRLAHPNELDTPLIEAKTTQLTNLNDELLPPSEGYDSSSETNSGALGAPTYAPNADGDQPQTAAADPLSSSSLGDEGSQTDSSSIEPGTWDELSQAEGGSSSQAAGAPNLFVADRTDGLRPTLQAADQSSSQDYELNDLVQFTCSSRAAPTERDVIKSVHLKWFINGQEISLNQVNGFDGSKFYNTRESSKPTTGNQSWQINTATTTTTNSDTDNDMNGHGVNRHNGQLRKSLLVEFTSSLFQLKELNLKCRTLVEQPLIEYDSQLIATVGQSTGHGFFQVHQPQVTSGSGNLRLSSSIGPQQPPHQRFNGRLYNNNNNNNGNQRNRNGFVRSPMTHHSTNSSSSSVAMSIFLQHYLSLLLLSSCAFNILVALRSSQQQAAVISNYFS